MGQRCSCLAADYALSTTKHEEAEHGQSKRWRGSCCVKSIDIELHILRLESRLQKIQCRRLSYSDDPKIIRLVGLATQSLGNNAAAKADLFQKSLQLCPSHEQRVFRYFFVFSRNEDILDELLSRGHSVLYMYGKPPWNVRNCDLSQYALMSDTDKRASMLAASEVLFSSLMPLRQLPEYSCCCSMVFSDRLAQENSRIEKLVLRSLQASNKTSAQVLGGLLANFKFSFDLNPNGLLKVFKCLVALGFDPSCALQSVEEIEDYRACKAYWRSQPQLSLKHLARQAVRDAITTNVVHAAPRLGLPASLQSYLLLEDILAVSEDAVAAAESAERC